MKIRVAQREEFKRIKSFYHTLIDRMADAEYAPAWKKDVYPSDAYLQGSLKNGQLYVGEIDNRLVAAMIVNNECNEGYKQVEWSVSAEPEEVLMIHTLGVGTNYSGRGIGKEMVERAIQLAMEKKMKTIRLDVLGGNVPAMRLYESMGFTQVDTIQMFYADTGWTDYILYEVVFDDAPVETPNPIFPHQHLEYVAEILSKRDKDHKQKRRFPWNRK